MNSKSGRILAVALAIFVLIPLCGFADAYNPKAYDISNIYKTIVEITSKEFNGRAAGTPDGKKTEDFFAAKFKEIGLTPGGDNGTYFQGFTGVRGEAEGPYLLEVVNGSTVVKTYTYATDYKYFLRYANSGDVTAPGKAVKKISGNMPKASGEIALLTAVDIPYGQAPQPLIDLYNAGYAGAIIQGADTLNRIKGQSGFFDPDASKLPRVSVSKPVFKELTKYIKKGYRIHLQSNFEVSNFDANNVIGVLEASTPTEECLIISGHMDHVSPDPDGVYFPGALDNAVGSSSVVEIARVLKSLNVKPSVNIVFIAFNGEETYDFGGSRKYVSAPLYPLQNTVMINLDGIGFRSKSQQSPIGLCVGSQSSEDEKTTALLNEACNVISDLQYESKVAKDDSCDHVSFAEAGVPAVTLMDWDIDVYHVPEDTIDNIGIYNLTRDMDITMNLIGKLAYR